MFQSPVVHVGFLLYYEIGSLPAGVKHDKYGAGQSQNNMQQAALFF